MRPKRAVTQTVSFRLDHHLFRLLAEQAAQRGVSPSSLARDLLRETLTDPIAQKTLTRMSKMETRLLALQQSLRHSTYTLLCQLGSKDEVAERFVDEYMAVE